MVLLNGGSREASKKITVLAYRVPDWLMGQQQSLLVLRWVDRSLHSRGQQRSLPALEQVWDPWRVCS